MPDVVGPGGHDLGSIIPGRTISFVHDQNRIRQYIPSFRTAHEEGVGIFYVLVGEALRLPLSRETDTLELEKQAPRLNDERDKWWTGERKQKQTALENATANTLFREQSCYIKGSPFPFQSWSFRKDTVSRALEKPVC